MGGGKLGDFALNVVSLEGKRNFVLGLRGSEERNVSGWA
jgi:hypothetical protein